ncbi:DUF4340 domain-containing protein [Candidatus Riflebacteria bacterium]
MLFIFWWFEVYKKNRAFEENDKSNRVFTFDLIELQSLNVYRPKEHFTISRKSNNSGESFALSYPEQKKLDSVALEKLKVIFKSLKFHNRFLKSNLATEDMVNYGLSSVSFKLELLYSNKKKEKYGIGKLNPTEELVYVLKNDKEVLLADRGLLDFLTYYSFYKISDRRLADFNIMASRDMEVIYRDGQNFHLRRSPNNEIHLLKPFKALLDYKKVAEFVESFIFIRKSGNLTEDDTSYSSYGLLEPAITVHIKDFSGQTLLWLFLGKTDKEFKNIYAKVDASPQIFLLPVKILTVIPRDIMSLISTDVSFFTKALKYNFAAIQMVTKDSKIRVVKPVALKGHTIPFATLRPILDRLRLKDYVKHNPTEQEHLDYKLKDYLFSIDLYNKRHTWLLGKKEGTYYYIFRKEENLLFKISSTLIENTSFSLKKAILTSKQ